MENKQQTFQKKILSSKLNYAREKFNHSEIKDFIESELGFGFEDIAVYEMVENQKKLRQLQAGNSDIVIVVYQNGNCDISYPL